MMNRGFLLTTEVRPPQATKQLASKKGTHSDATWPDFFQISPGLSGSVLFSH